ncbi:uncharacterized protein LOC112083942 [Eutrema salsugineum]|uniref:uncharacterized protein LOC112083942 n=1 Tax=Eutrema salsugineum TaxID=72664 RepID=UPI000CED5FA3|nr:uncharacterized protein LOC112083942 [Eutrema salsugineum]
MDRSKEDLNITHLEDEDEEIIELPHVDNSHLIARFSRSLVGIMFNSEIRSTDALITFMPRQNIWDVEGRVHGIDLGNSRFQFDFDSEADLLKRWTPHVGETFPNNKIIWVRISCIPTHFWVEENFSTTGKCLGDVKAVDARVARVQVSVNADKRLKFSAKVKLESSEIVKIGLKYEKLGDDALPVDTSSMMKELVLSC